MVCCGGRSNHQQDYVNVFGWCLDGHHKDCIKESERFFIGPVGKGRKKKQGIIWTDEINKCSCYCHTGVAKKITKTTHGGRNNASI